MVGAVVMSFDYIDALKEEAKKQGSQSLGQVLGGCCCLIIGCCVALLSVFALVWGQGNVEPLFMEEMLSHTMQLKDVLISVIPELDTGYVISDSLIWTALCIFVATGAVVMRFDFVEAAEE